jgi:predicted Zn-dependent peptidase
MFKSISLFLTIAVLSCVSIASAAQTQALPNGVPLVVDPVQMAPYVSMTVLIKAGAADETADTAGWRQLLASAMMRATANGKDVLEGPQLTQAAEVAGGQMGAQVLDDAIVFTAAGDSATQKELANLLLNVVLHPRLSDADFSAARRGMLRNLNASDRNDVPDHSRATETLQALLYRDSTSKKPIKYGLPPGGTVDSLTALTDDKLKSLYQKYFSSARMIIAVSGDADHGGLEKVFSQVPATAADAEHATSSYAAVTPATSQSVQMNTPAPWTLIGFRIDPAINASAKELASLRVLTAALAETAPSLLSQKLLSPSGRNQAGLADQISGQLSIRKDGSELMLAVQSDESSLAASKAAVLQVINDLKTKPLSAAQIESAILYAQGDWASTRDSSTIRAVLAGYAKAQGIFPDDQWPAQLKSVTAADVQNVAKKYLNQHAEVKVN